MNLKDFKMAPFYDLDKKWALLSVGSKEKYNTMTISWGGFGTLWHKPIATVYVRKSRYTYEFLQKGDYFTISFFDEAYKKDLGILGSRSGRDGDKVSLTNLTPEFLNNIPTFKEANLVIVCKRIFNQELDADRIPKEYVDSFYKDEEIHEMFIGEVVDIIERKQR